MAGAGGLGLEPSEVVGDEVFGGAVRALDDHESPGVGLFGHEMVALA